MPKKSPQCHNSSGCTLWKKCHLFATYGLTYLCRYVHPNGRLLWVSRESSQGNRILLLLSWWTCMLIAAFQLYCTAAAKAWDTKRNWNQLQNKQRYYIWKKGTWDNFRLRKLPKHHFYVGFKNEFSTHWVRKWFKKFTLKSLNETFLNILNHCVKAVSKMKSLMFQILAVVTIFNKIRFVHFPFILERNYYRNVALHFCHPLGNLGFILREKIFVGKTTSTPDWTKKKIPKRILWRAKKRDSRTLLTLDQAKKFFVGHHHCTESPFFLNWKVLFVSSSFQAYLLSFPLFPLIAFEA